MQAAAANLIKFVRTEMNAYRLYTVRPSTPPPPPVLSGHAASLTPY